MNPTLKTLLSRRSVRKYKSDKIPKEVLDEIIAAGLYAPTGRNRQAPAIIVITDPETRAAIARKNSEIGGWGDGFDPFFGAPAVLLVIAKKCNTDVYDGSCAIANIMNAAWSLGVASCWVHRAKEEIESDFGRELLSGLGLNADDYIGVGHVALGYADGDIPEAKPRDDNRVFYK